MDKVYKEEPLINVSEAEDNLYCQISAAIKSKPCGHFDQVDAVMNVVREDFTLAREIRLLAAQENKTAENIFARGLVTMIGTPMPLSAIEDAKQLEN